MNHYQFYNEVYLTYDKSGYHIYVKKRKLDESEFTAEQLKNPLIAQTRFMNAINNYFYKKISNYIKETGRKKGLGCKSSYPDCKSCVQSGYYQQKGSECFVGENQAESIRRNYDDSN